MRPETKALEVKRMSHGESILITDNDAECRAAMASALQKAGYEIIEADDGDVAIDTARGELPRLVILDVNLPSLSGYEVCHELKEDFGDGLPIILISGERTEAFDRVAGMLIGADDYLVKPIAVDELLVRVRRLVRSTTPVAAGVGFQLPPPGNKG